ncbi:carbonic anhydrase 1-like [Anabrus simplex]|uniref:carbonic anhydrase 1-like n=1 Tax=Anabrus simplex TaxID=316456 RepID=UPI0035A2D539
MSWGYANNNGPSTWGGSFPNAGGKSQSPINIVKENVQCDATLNKPPLVCKYGPKASQYILNSGHGVKVHMEAKGCGLQGGPLEGNFSPDNWHCHWGATSEEGSEHTIDGQAYAGEIHIVHWNSTKYKSCEEAADKEDGLAVIGILLKIGKAHGEMQKLVSLLPQIQYSEAKASIPKGIDIGKFIPGSKIYYTYPGSLTTPPCTENVTWIVFRDPIDVCEEQLAAFRTVLVYKEGDNAPSDGNEGKVVKCFRPVCALNDRVVREGKAK